MYVKRLRSDRKEEHKYQEDIGIAKDLDDTSMRSHIAVNFLFELTLNLL